MFEIRTTRTNALVANLLDDHQAKLLRTVISKSASLNQANLERRPVVAYASSGGAQEYDALCEEVCRLRI